VQIVLAAHPLLRLAPELALVSVTVPLREQCPALAKVLGQVLGDEAALGQHELLFLGRVGRIGKGDADEGGLP
jgi:hypothetical protein